MYIDFYIIGNDYLEGMWCDNKYFLKGLNINLLFYFYKVYIICIWEGKNLVYIIIV